MNGATGGKTPEESGRGKDRAWRIPIRGCLTTVVVLVIACYVLYRLLIGVGGAAQISL